MPGLLVLTHLQPTLTDDDQGVSFTAVSWLVAFGTGFALRKVLHGLWERSTGTAPPKNPADPTVDWQEALTWAAATGMGVGVGRVVARRLLADAWPGSPGQGDR